MVGLLSLLGGPSIPPGAPSGGVSNGNYRKNDNSLMVVPSVNVPHGAAAQKHPKLMAPPFLQPRPLGGIGSYFGDQPLM